MKNLTFKYAAVTVAALAFVLPAQALAACGQTSGSYVVTCEKGVQVYRHQAKSATPQLMQTNNSAASSSARGYNATALQLEARRIKIEERRQAAEQSDLIRTRIGYNRGRLQSRRFVTTSGQGYSRNRFNTARARLNTRNHVKVRYR
jgi:hypothetical protein